MPTFKRVNNTPSRANTNVKCDAFDGALCFIIDVLPLIQGLLYPWQGQRYNLDGAKKYGIIVVNNQLEIPAGITIPKIGFENY